MVLEHYFSGYSIKKDWHEEGGDGSRTTLWSKEVVITVYLFWSIRMDGAQSGGVKPPSGRSVWIEHFRGKMWLFNYDTGIVNALLINKMSAHHPRRGAPAADQCQNF